MVQRNTISVEGKLSGQVVINELIRNMELGQFEMGYSVLLPCVFSLYLHPEDYARLEGVFELIAEDARPKQFLVRLEVRRVRNPRRHVVGADAHHDRAGFGHAVVEAEHAASYFCPCGARAARGTPGPR